MKKIKNLFLLLLIAFSMLLCGCSFFPEDSDADFGDGNKIESFELVTDEKMIYDNSSDDEYYKLELYAGESYTIKTTADDKLGGDYYLKYRTGDEASGKFTVSEAGLIQVNADIDKNEAFVINVDLYRHGTQKRVANTYCILLIKAEEYASISLTNDNLEYDSASSTYSFSMPSGESYKISYSVSSNTSYTLTFSVKSAHLPFMSIDSEGNVTTKKTSEDKEGEIIIKAIGADGVLDTVYLKISLDKNDELANGITVFNRDIAEEIGNGDTLEMYKGASTSFDVKNNGESKTNVITVSDPSVLEVDNSTNTIKAISGGESEVTFSYGSESITITVRVKIDELIAIGCESEGDSLIILNGLLRYLDKVYAEYESGAKIEISDLSLIGVKLSDKNEAYKTATLNYTEDEKTVSVSYDVKFYTALDYIGQSTSYDNNDYLDNYYLGTTSALPKEGTVKLLVIPVWFSDSDRFFNETQKEELIADIEHSMNGERPSSEFKSVKQYYEAQSFGKISLDITVSDFYTSSTSYKNFSDNIEGKSNNARILGSDAISWYFTNHENEELESYDMNDDGYLDGLVLFYASNYYGDESDKNRSVAFATSNNDNTDYSFNTMCFCPIGGLYGLDRKTPDKQLTAADLSELYAQDFKMSSRTVIHEIGHMFGNEDLYEDQFADETYSPTGGFVMQDHNLGGHDPYHLNKLGWTKPDIYASSDYELGDKITLNISDFQSSGQNIILTNKWNSSNSLFDEYLIIELFTPTGLNEYDAKSYFMNSLKSGIRLWHVNSVLTDIHDEENKTSEIKDGHLYYLAYDNHDVESEYDLLHWIRNDSEETFHTDSTLYGTNALFRSGDSFDMETFGKQFLGGGKLDNGEKLGWAFTVDAIYENSDGTFGAVITLERTDNVRTEFTKKATLNRSDLETPDGEEEYGDDIFGADGEFSLIYKYVTPPSFYAQGYPISSDGMCLFAKEDGNGGYIELTIKDIDGKEVVINSITLTYSRLTNAELTVMVGGNEIDGTEIETESNETLGFEYEVNASSVRIQNQYSGTVDHWSVIALLEITIEYTIE